MTRVTIAGLTFLLDRDQAFADARGITHEGLTTNHRIGVVSLCGRVRDPVPVEDKTLLQLRAYASARSPEGVDCMTCLVARVRLDVAIEETPPPMRGPAPDGLVAIDLRIASWR
jgi:hypothetical protein